MEKRREEVKNYIIDRIEEYRGSNIYMNDLHYELFNTDYYIIGREKARKWVGSACFDIMDAIKKYEQDNFGEVTTDLHDPEKVVNMYVYILGEEILSGCDVTNDIDRLHLTDEDIDELIVELKE